MTETGAFYWQSVGEFLLGCGVIWFLTRSIGSKNPIDRLKTDLIDSWKEIKKEIHR